MRRGVMNNMRQIKFRAWDSIENKMLPPLDIIEIANIGSLSGHFSSEEAQKDIFIMQFTGLKDKNGVEIYEGDILENFIEEGNDWKDDAVFYQQIIWSENEAAFINKKTENFLDKEELATEYKVIGNIYENPELLNEK